MNSVHLLGRLTRDTETRTAGQHTVTKFGIALDNGKDKGGQKRPATFLTCKAWDKTGDVISKYFNKGDMIAIDGRIDVEQWEKNGQRHERTVITVDRIHFTGAPKKEQQPKPHAEMEYQPIPEPTGPSEFDNVAPPDDSDIPF
jgi:single-strand DNA-binding protein